MRLNTRNWYKLSVYRDGHAHYSVCAVCASITLNTILVVFVNEIYIGNSKRSIVFFVCILMLSLSLSLSAELE